MEPVTIKTLREKISAGYNLAVLVGMEHDINDLSVFEVGGLPVLKEARGPLGVLRNLDISGRMSGILGHMESTGEEYRLLHLEFAPDGCAMLNDYKFRVKR